MASFIFRVKNVRCLADCALEVPAGAMTTVVGVNNSGKSSLLEMMARTIWSIPAFGRIPERKFSSRWYRRADGVPHRPMSHVTMPLEWAALGEPALAPPGVLLGADFAGALVETRATPGVETEMSPVKVVLRGEHGEEGVLVEASSDWTNAADLTAAQLPVSSLLVSENRRIQWQPAAAESRHIVDHNTLDRRNTPLAHALGLLRERTFHIPANRSPGFESDGTDRRLQHGTLYAVTALLKRLNHDRPRFDGFRTAVTQLFDEVEDVVLQEQANEIAPFAVLEGGDRVPVGDMGYGFRNAVHLLAVLSAAEKCSVFFIDEPEQGLNQAKQRDLAVLLQTLRAGEVTIVAATQAEAFCGGLDAGSPLLLLKRDENASSARRLSIREKDADRLALARAMGIDPLFVAAGGKIVFVEGSSDQTIIEKWMLLNGLSRERVAVEALGGCGKVNMEFAKVLFAQFKDRIFFLLDSDGSSATAPRSEPITDLVAFFQKSDISNFYILRRRELENYLDLEKIAEAADMHPSHLKSVPGYEDFHDIKAAFRKSKAYEYPVRHSEKAFELMNTAKQRELFGEESAGLIGHLRQFVDA